MITAQCETYSTIIDEALNIFPTHWQELALNKDKVPLNPHYDIYQKKEKEGQLLVISLREEAKLIGYFVGFVGRSLHYKDMMTCTPDIYYVLQDKRLQNAGTILFNFVKQELKRRGVVYWVIGDKNHKSAGEFFEGLGFNKIENYYSMWIGE